MGDVITLKRDPDEPHLSGKVRCLHCKHEWVGVSPVGTYEGLECPACGLSKGVYVSTFWPPSGVEVFVCACGCDVFSLLRDRWLCINCGVQQRF